MSVYILAIVVLDSQWDVERNISLFQRAARTILKMHVLSFICLWSDWWWNCH